MGQAEVTREKAAVRGRWNQRSNHAAFSISAEEVHFSSGRPVETHPHHKSPNPKSHFGKQIGVGRSVGGLNGQAKFSWWISQKMLKMEMQTSISRGFQFQGRRGKDHVFRRNTRVRHHRATMWSNTPQGGSLNLHQRTQGPPQRIPGDPSRRTGRR